MPDIPPNIPGSPLGNIPGAPAGAQPMKKTTGKVQPKKETVRITLPPKPSAAPTIKLPTLPPGGPTGASSPLPSAAQPPTAAKPAPAAQPPPQRAAAAPVSQQRPIPAPAKAAPAGARTLSALDSVLAIAAAVAGLFAVGTVIWLLLLPTT